ncbi:MAG: protein kinase [Nitrospirae bacterium]|nr:protein kinase [Nitrospirota bacterium]MBF0618152.1 protein kinase [Nitrospirota bacterium]
MPIITACPTCGSKYSVSSSLTGKNAKCKKCGSTFKIEKYRTEQSSASMQTMEKGSGCSWNVGDVILDLYEVSGLLGEGGMGKVYKVKHKGWNVDLAVKCPKSAELARAGGSENFEREAETWVNLGLHPHIVSCYYVREVDEVPMVFAEYVDGGSLNDWIHDGKLNTLDAILDASIQFAWGLHYAHEKGLIHQDVKPANVMMTSEGIAKVTDFGLAKAVGMSYGQDSFEDYGLNKLVTPGGMTPAFCSPEQANQEKLSLKTDIWSWAVSVLVMFTGEVTWPSGTVAGEALKWYHESVADGLSNKSLPAMPDELAELLARCFNENPIERPDSMSDVASELIKIYEKLTGKNYARTAPEVSMATADSLNNRAVSLLDLGREEEAERLWTEALRIQPHHPESSFNLGLTQWRGASMTDNALVRLLEEVQRSHPENPIVKYLAGLVHLERDDCALALKYLNDIDPTITHLEDIRYAIVYAESQKGRSKGCLKTFTGHDEPVTAVGLSADGRIAVSGSLDKTLRLWDTETGTCLKTFTGHADGILSAYMLPDATLIISGSLDKTVRVWDVKSGYCFQTFKGHMEGVTSVFIEPGGRNPLSGSSDETIKLWDTSTGTYLRSFVGHKGDVTSVYLTKDGKLVVSACKDGTIRLWEVASLRCLHTFKGHNGAVNFMSVSKNGQTMASAGADKTVKLWDLTTRIYSKTMYGHGEAVSGVFVDSAGKTLVSVSHDKTMIQWAVDSGRCMRTFEGHTEPVNAVALSEDGRFAATCGNDKLVKFWEVSSNRESFRAPMMLSQVLKSEAAFSAMAAYSQELTEAKKRFTEGNFKKAASHIRKARSQRGFSRDIEALTLWMKLYLRFPRHTFVGGWEGTTFKGHSGAVTSISADSHSKLLLTGSIDKTIRLWDIESGDLINTFKGFPAGITSVHLSEDGLYAVAGTMDKTISFWDIKKGKQMRALKGHEGVVRSVCLSNDHHLAVTSGDDKTVKVWDITTGRLIRTYDGHPDPVMAVSLNADNRFFITGCADGKLKMWEMTTANFLGILATYEGHTDVINTVALSLDGKLAVTGSEDMSIRVWDLSLGKCVKTLEGHTAGVTTVSISSDNKFLLSGSNDNAVRLWDIRSESCVRVFKGHQLGINSVLLSRHGRHAFSAGDDGEIKLWTLDWEIDDTKEGRYDDSAAGYLELFLASFVPYVSGSLARRGKPDWKDKDLEELFYKLGCVGYGWISHDVIKKELKIIESKKFSK